MNETASVKTPWHLWVVGLVALLWNAGGAFDYVMTQSMNMEYLEYGAENAGVPVDAFIGYYTNFPAWADAMWAFGVWGAVAGSVLLLLRSRFAYHAFIIGLIGLIGTSLYTFTSEIPSELKTPFMWIFSAIIFIVTIVLIVYAKKMTEVGVLR